ncbi:hypothetical protein V7182_04515 [Neobacillus drentensis]|uniref:hypothetical protein n=1 Tax=Neobacillus drentensis TaxID=220684 RepID=UPI003000929B
MPIRPTDEQLEQAVYSELTWDEIAKKFDYKDSKPLRKRAANLGYMKRKILKPSKLQLERMILHDKMNAYEVSERLGYAENGWSLIYKYCREYEIPVDNKPHEDLRRTDFTSEQRSIVYGTLLGDGSLRNTYKNYALVIAQGEKQNK